jgi:hypothetical protein
MEPTDQAIIFPNMAAALARSAQCAAAVKCDGVRSKYWWRSIALTNGTVAMIIKASGPYGANVVTANGISGLTAAEKAQLQPCSVWSPLLPPA